ncbi:DsbA family protein [Rhizobium sp. NLR17b]|uniref:DsbA family protein n=1 Tax=Rhizobium sp. NLR17b TaxID=2731114 RepID=UPI001C8338FF|nr:DsbA family protein [Rhizobium sp. NLR17b]MBX5273223.1 DsbA family protein [Rhizobium sp. NLR17b]
MQLTYLFDPLCGWCFGAGPVLEQLSQLPGITLYLAPTGLFAGENARPMDAGFAAFAWQNDQRIARLTGQKFSDGYRARVLGASGAMFDSAPTTLGLVAVGLTAPNREIEALKLLQRVRYVDGRNNADLSVVADVLASAGFDEAAGRVMSPDEELLAAYRARVDAARRDMARFGAQGVPGLIAKEGSGSRLLQSNLLFGDFKALAAQLQSV